MSSQNVTHDSSTDTDQLEAHCGHVVPEDETAYYVGEFTNCEDCYLDTDSEWFGLDDYPDVLRTRTDTVHNARGASTHVSRVSLIGITNERTALYYDGIDGRLWEVAPAHSGFHDTEDAARRPLLDVDSDCTLGAPHDFSRDEYHTLPNGDHLALLDSSEAPYSFSEWLVAHADEFRSFTDEYRPRGQ